MKTQYKRSEESVALISGATKKVHGNRKLTEKQEKMLLLVLIVLSGMNKGVLGRLLGGIVLKFFEFSVSRGWIQSFLKRNNEDILKCKTKLLAKKTALVEIPDHVAQFLEKFERCREDFEMMAAAVCNYDKKRVYVDADGLFLLENFGKEKAMHL